MQRLRRLLLRLAALVMRASTDAAPEPRRVLLVKPDHLGDLLLLTPALQRLREGLPGAHIALLVGPWAVEAVQGNPDVDAVLVCPFPGFTRRAKPGLLQPYTLLLRTALLLRVGHYDVALIARDDHWWGALLALVAGIPRRIGYAAPDVAALLTERLPYDDREHVTLQGLKLVDHLTGRRPESLPAMRAPITADDEAWAGAWLQAHGVESDLRLVAIHPGSGGQAKLWIASRWGMVADALMQDGTQVILTGGPSEQGLIAEVAAGLRRRPLLLVGEATLGQLAAIYRRCTLVAGVDSGPLHLAAAAGVRTITLYGPVDHGRFASWGPEGRHTIVRSGLWCSPCGAVEGCPRGTSPSECMTTIGVSQVLAAVEQAGPGRTSATSA